MHCLKFDSISWKIFLEREERIVSTYSWLSDFTNETDKIGTTQYSQLVRANERNTNINTIKLGNFKTRLFQII